MSSPARADYRQMWADAECRANEASSVLGRVERLADEWAWNVNDPNIPFEAKKVYASVARDLYNALADPLNGPLFASAPTPSPQDPAVCFCGKAKSEHPPGPPCPPPPPPGVPHG